MKVSRLFIEVLEIDEDLLRVALTACIKDDIYKGLEDPYVHIGSFSMPETEEPEEIAKTVKEKLDADGGINKVFSMLFPSVTEEEINKLWRNEIEIFWTDDLLSDIINGME